MSAGHSQLFLVGIFVALNLPSSAAWADPASSVAPVNPASSVAPVNPASSVAPVNPASSVAPVDPEKLMEQAVKALDREDLDVAVKLYVQAAQLNYTPAQVALGQFNDSAQFYEAAVGWFLMAATQGDAAGQYDLGRMYVAGNGIEKDEAKASYWFKRSAAKNFLPAVKLLAGAYRSGTLGLKVDLDQAKSWDAKATRLEAIERKAADEHLAAVLAARKKSQEEAAKKANK